MEYIIRTENFEGPFELLLELIKKRAMNIHDLQISEITNDFIANLKEMQNSDIEVTSDFMEMASMLLEIKSKILLPVETAKKDPRSDLVQQLLDYQEYKESIEKLKELKDIERKFFKRQRVEKVKVKKKGNIHDIFKIYQNVLMKKISKATSTPLDTLTEELMRFNYTIEGQIHHIQTYLENQRMDLIAHFDDMNDKEELVTTYGALLELVKIQYIDILVIDERVYIEKRKDDLDG